MVAGLQPGFQHLVAGAGEGRINAMPDVAKALNRDLLARAKAAR